MVQCGAHDFQFGMLVLHGSFHIRVPHRLHHRRQIPSSAEDASSLIVPSAIQHEIVRQARLFPSQPELMRHGRQMTAFCTLGWEHPSFTLFANAIAQQLATAITHRNHSPAVWGLAVRHEDGAILSINVFDPHAVQLSPVSHSRVSCENHDIAKQLEAALPPAE